MTTRNTEAKRMALLLLLVVVLAAGSIGRADARVCNTISIAMASSFHSQMLNYGNCSIVDGSVVLSMTELNGELSFPKLVEISGFLVLYRVKNLTSLVDLFPRLMVIRGFSTHENYALVIFDLPDLKDMALPWLRYIGRGGVRIENAPKLCYSSTVDWEAIVRPAFHKEIKFDNLPDNMLCGNACPGKLVWNEPRSKYLYRSDCPDRCWSQHVCQSQCNATCGESGCQMTDPAACCHPSCLAGCTGPSASDCLACRHLLLDGRCVDRCPASHVSHESWMCIAQSECLSRRYAVKSAAKNSLQAGRRNSMKLFNGTCVETCPVGYEISGRSCVKCADKSNCTRYCEGLLVHSIEDLESVRGCTTIGRLIISLSENIPDLEKKLEESFRNLTEIDHYLLITNSRDLTSLSFLSNLRVIRGKHLDEGPPSSKNPTIKIEHTDFLQSLWNTTGGRRVQVPRGKVRFYMNRRLCYNRIQTFVNQTLNVSDPVNEAEDLSPKTNGDLAYCINRTFDLHVGLVHATGVILHWPNIRLSDQRFLVGYSIYYRMVGPAEVAQYADPSTCEIRQWQTTFSQCTNVYAMDAGANPLRPKPNACRLRNCSQCVGDCFNKLGDQQCQQFVQDLKPASRYALFVMPQVVLERQHEYGSKSRIIYVETLPTQPSPPHSFTGTATGKDEIQLEWKPPLVPNGRVTHYLLWVKEIPSYQESYALKDYCDERDKRDKQQQQQQQQLDATAAALGVAFLPGDTVGRPAGPGAPSVNGSVTSVAAAAATAAATAATCKRHCQCEQGPDLKRREKVIYFEDTLLRIMFRRRPEIGSLRSVSSGSKIPVPSNSRGSGAATSAATAAAASARASAEDTDSTDDPTDFGAAAAAAAATTPPSSLPLTTTTSASAAAATTAAAGCQHAACPDDIVEKAALVPPDSRGLADGYIIVRGTQYTVTNRKHFTYYELMLVACLDEFRHPQYHTALHLCSNPARIMRRTQGHSASDQIPAGSLNVAILGRHTGDVQLLWQEPPSPNGAVIYYNVHYKTPNHGSWQTHCVSYQEWLNRGQKRAAAAPAPDGENASKGQQRQSRPSRSVADDKQIGGTLLKSLGEGTYRLRVQAVTLYSEGGWTEVSLSVSRRSGRFPGLSAETLPGVLLVALLLLGACAAVGGWLAYRHKHREKTIVNENPDYWSYTYEPDEWEVPRDQVSYRLEDKLGTGSFGRVYRGLVRSLNTPAARYLGQSEDVPVAVKSVNEKATMRERHEFLQEATHMKKFRQCAHVVRLIGVVSENVPILVLMELMDFGDLKTCLRQMRPDSDELIHRPMYTRQLLVQWCAQIADGMFYLETKKYIHRDLAARNCMVTAAYSVKIGDFGMTRDVYYSDYYKKEGQAPLPVRWMAPESLRDGVFTTASDVWSYGVVLWEVASLASQPFNGRSNEEVLNMVKSGKTLEPPDDCPDFVADLMNRCWAQKPRSRSSFRDILAYLEDLPEITDLFRKTSWYHNSSSQGDSAVTVCLPDKTSIASSSASSTATAGPAANGGGGVGDFHKPPEEIPMLQQQSVPNAYVQLRA